MEFRGGEVHVLTWVGWVGSGRGDGEERAVGLVRGKEVIGGAVDEGREEGQGRMVREERTARTNVERPPREQISQRGLRPTTLEMRMGSEASEETCGEREYAVQHTSHSGPAAPRYSPRAPVDGYRDKTRSADD